MATSRADLQLELMSERDQVFSGKNKTLNHNEPVEGEFVMLDGEGYYKISNYNKMAPFFISLVSNSDHWMFISTTGGLTAGRVNEDNALFPYYTDDILTANHYRTGNVTLMKVKLDGKVFMWEPFRDKTLDLYDIQRSLYRNVTNNKIIFEEINKELGLKYIYSWQFSEKFGIVKRSMISNIGDVEREIEILDGIQDVMPYGVGADLQNKRSNLVNAYRKNELHEASGLGLFMLSAIIVDKAEPSEALKTTSVWNIGLDPKNILLSNGQLDSFRKGNDVELERDVKAVEGAYIVNTTLTISANESVDWLTVAELEQDHGSIADLVYQLKNKKGTLKEEVLDDVELGTLALKKLVGQADGLQLTADKLTVNRHYSNVLFNIMRGGTFDESYFIDQRDFLDYFHEKCPAKGQSEFLSNLPSQMKYDYFIEQARLSGDTDILRICLEYLPLSFSRRHGDPSRPWNKFSIQLTDEQGNKKRNYEGNWRDIFQNWEALAVSFPSYLPAMIARFVNASTIDGYNPYRVTRTGIDWEEVEPNDPWSFIGYWGDHQVIYLLKFLELLQKHDKSSLEELLTNDSFVYSNVPYKIKSFDDIKANPQDTIIFDHQLADDIAQREKLEGEEAKLLQWSSGDLVRANLTEKLLVMVLTKLSNFIPEGGIWLNTQRPEWNDANNALVGNGISMVTLYYMRRCMKFIESMYEGVANESMAVNSFVEKYFNDINQVFVDHKDYLVKEIGDKSRMVVVDQLGKAGENYRNEVYDLKKASRSSIQVSDLLSFSGHVLSALDHSIAANKRKDGLYHSYNLLAFNDDDAVVSNMYEMLEGQVAVLSSGVLSYGETLEVLDRLKASDMYREEQYSYMLYPDRDLPTFMQKNTIPKSFMQGSSFAQSLLSSKDRTILYEDRNGDYHFNGGFNNVNDLVAALDQYQAVGKVDVAAYDDLKNVFEEVFNHKAFTGRSGTFFGYEGLGSIYWHMVSKLLLATQENIFKSHDEDSLITGRMIDHYYQIRAGIGINKTPELYGAIPTDPYSHTPATKGVQQPGMTGQVKEDVLNRWAELGVDVQQGALSFNPVILDKKEFLKKQSVFEFVDISGNLSSLDIMPGQLAFTYCQVPIIYTLGVKSSIKITMANKDVMKYEGTANLSAEDSKMIFDRNGDIYSIGVTINY
ncbi:MAG: hypothetical protein OCD76_22265 [Reichenbachiella sp.]